MGFIVAILLFVSLVGIFLATFIMNKNVVLTEDIDLKDVECNGCKITTCKRNINYNKDLNIDK